ncbi:MAG: hypothetical protein WKF48_01170 [Solirubrobacteraceae bacterium]
MIRNCNVPGYATAPITPWKASLVPNLALFNNCGSGGGFGLTFPGLRSLNAYMKPSIELHEPDGTQLRRVRLWLVTRLSGTGSQAFGVLFIVKGPDAYSIHDFLPPGEARLVAPINTELTPETEGYRASLVCAGYGGNEPAAPACSLTDSEPLEVRGAETTIEETRAPTGSVTGGTLITDRPVSGTKSLDYSVSDGESGVKLIEAIIGNVVVAAKDLNGSCTYADFAACPSVDSGTLAINTGQVSDGIQPVILRVTDAAGNYNAFQVQLINVQNARDPSAGPVANGVNEARKLTARFVGSKRPTIIVPFSRRFTVRGRLSTASKSGIGSASIDVLQRSGAKEKRVGSATTRKDGTFTYRRTVRGPTRTLQFVYREKSGVAAASPKLRLRVRASASLRVRLKGITLRFSGRVLSRPLPQNGKELRLQGRTPGFTWATFAKKRTDRRGRFAGSYRLPVRRPGVRLQIRAWIPGERGYRYLSYRGKPREIRVR